MILPYTVPQVHGSKQRMKCVENSAQARQLYVAKVGKTLVRKENKKEFPLQILRQIIHGVMPGKKGMFS